MSEENSRLNEEIIRGAPFAALSYVLFMSIFVLKYKKGNSFSRFHARQGLVIFILETVLWLIYSTVPIIGFFAGAGLLILFIFSCIGVFAGLMGKYVKFPIVYGIAEKIII